MFFLCLTEYYVSNIFYILSFVLSFWLLFMYYENRFLNIWFIKYKCSKLLFSLLSLFLVLYLSVDAFSQLNDIFGVNSNIFVYTQTVVTAISFISILSGTILIIGLLSQLIFLYELFFPSNNGSLEFKQRGILVINGIVILFSFIGFAHPYVSQKERSKLIENIALKVDFGRHLCLNIERKKSCLS
jgi:hypothetical protein